MSTLLEHAECLSHSQFSRPNVILREIKTLSPNPRDILSLISLNIRSIRKNFNLLLLLLRSLKHPLSIIALCETFLNDGEEELFAIDGYTMYHLNRINNSRSGGLMIYVNDSLTSFLHVSLTMANEFFESIFVSLKIKKQDHTFGLIYRSPSLSIPQFVNSFNVNILSHLSCERTTICGDFNINLFNSPSTSGLRFVADLYEKNLGTVITERTRPYIVQQSMSANRSRSQYDGTLIDHIWSSYGEDLRSYVIDFLISDHFPICVFIHIPNANNKIKYKSRSFTVNQLLKYSDEFELFSNNFSISVNDPNLNCNIFLNSITSNIKTNFPISEKTKRTQQLNAPWIDKRLLKCVNKKNTIYKNYKLDLTTWDEFKKYRNLLNKALGIAKKIYIQEKIESAKSPKDTWKVINNLKSNKKSTKMCINIDGDRLVDPKLLVLKFSDNFYHAIKLLIGNSSIPNTICLIPPVADDFVFSEITCDEVLTTIYSLKNNNKHKEEIPTILLKHLGPKMSVILTALFNNFVTNSVFPDSLKLGKIIPIYKKGPRDNIDNYRQITIQNPVTKSFEKITSNRLTEFFESKSILAKEQYGFTKGRSIQNATLSLLYDIYEAHDKREKLGAVFVDLSKAFDTVNHTLLLSKLNNYGIHNHELELMKSFLSNRFNYVEIDNARSSLRGLECGVPQGSSLGPLLFNIFINDIPKVIKKCKIMLFADDIVIYYSSKNLEEINSALNYDLENIYNYLCSNLLFMNFDKTKSMLFNNPVNETLNICLKSTNIDMIYEFKYLGLIIDHKLTFNSQILALTKKLDKCNATISYLKRFLPIHCLLKLYYSHAYTHIVLHIMSWGGTFPSYLRPLNSSHNKIIRNIHSRTARTYIDTNNCYKDLGLFTISQLYQIRLAEFTYLSIRNNSPIPQNLLDKVQWRHNYNTRRRDPLRMPFVPDGFLKRSFIYNAVKLWNQLNVARQVEAYESIAAFKTELRNEIKIINYQLT